jgi:hypothetical protein
MTIGDHISRSREGNHQSEENDGHNGLVDMAEATPRATITSENSLFSDIRAPETNANALFHE